MALLISPTIVSLIGLALLTVSPMAAQLPSVSAVELPDLAVTKAAAEAGDSGAQLSLGSRYFAAFDFETGEKWIRLAAMQGLADAQNYLGRVLISGKPAFRAGQTGIKKDVAEALEWFERAAAQGKASAMTSLGDCFRRGIGYQLNRVQAYKWLKLASDRTDILGRVYLDDLILQMSELEISQGQMEARKFAVQPRRPVVPKVPDGEPLSLHGISGITANRVAILNNKPFAIGETRRIRVLGKDLSVRCNSIGATSVWVQVEGSPLAQEVMFKPR